MAFGNYGGFKFKQLILISVGKVLHFPQPLRSMLFIEGDNYQSKGLCDCQLSFQLLEGTPYLQPFE